MLVLDADLRLPLEGPQAAEPAAVLGWSVRLLLCHLTHTSTEHALLNGLGLALLWPALGGSWRHRALNCCARACLTSVLLLAHKLVLGTGWPGTHYAGASGILHGLWIRMSLIWLKQSPGHAALMACTLLGKLLLDFSVERTTADGTLVTPIAHLYGALAGMALGLGQQCHRRHGEPGLTQPFDQ